MSTFTDIQKNFAEVFRQLFEGGTATLELTEPGNVLESGIEIFVRPPGKKLKNINLLSGGERALTAIALLFATYMVKPSPFCFLDEIDAPLDEENIGRFVRMLQRVLEELPVHHRHPQQEDHEHRRNHLRRHHGGAGRLQGGVPPDGEGAEKGGLSAPAAPSLLCLIKISI